MFDVGFLELLVVAVVALVVVGPERLPKLARTVGMWVGRGRRFISSVKEDIDREIKADELRQILAKQKQSNPLHEIVADTKKNFADIKSETESAVNAATKPAPPQNDKS